MLFFPRPRPVLLWLIVFIFMAGWSARARADAYDDMRAAWFDHVTGGVDYDPTDPAIQSAVNAMTSSANASWAQLQSAKPFKATCFSDLSFGTSSANVNSAYTRLQNMAQAYWAKGGTLYKNPDLLADTIAGLDWMYANVYNESVKEYDNWWNWEIGIPLALNPTVTMLYDFLTPAQLANYMNAVDQFTPDTNTTGGGGGANGAWGAIVVGVRAVLVKDPAKLQLARDAFSTLTSDITAGDGFYADGSYIGHQYLSYNGGYGFYFLQSLADGYLLMGPGTPFPMPDAKRAVAYQWVEKSYWPLLYHGQTPYFSIGREIGRGPSGNRSSAMGYTFLELTGNDPSPEAVRMRCLAKSIFLDGGSSYPTSIGQLVAMKTLVADRTVTALPDASSTTVFPIMNKAVVLRPNWGVGLSFYSVAIHNYEDAGENMRGWHQSDGMVYVNNADTEQFNGNFWPTVNSYRLPGTTVTLNTTSSGGRSNGDTFAGGAQLGDTCAAVGFILKPGNGQSLVANKAWFTFHDEVVCLGAGITSTDGKGVETVIENRRLNPAGSNALTVDGTAQPAALATSNSLANVHWMHLAGSVPGSDIGYVFPTPTKIDLVREARTGAWSNLRTGSSSATVSSNFLTATTSHGANPNGGSYAYVLLPNASAAQVAAYSAAPAAAILANDGNASAVQDAKLGVSGAVFWQDQTARVILDGGSTALSSDKKAVVIAQDTGGQVTVAVSDPTQSNKGVIHVELDRPFAAVVSTDSAVTVTQLSPVLKLTVAVSGSKGQTFRAVLAPPPSVVAPQVVTAATSGVTGTPLVYQIVANHTPTGYSATGLPGGLALDAATGLVSGTPTTAGSFTINLTATNAGGQGSGVLTLVVALPPPPAIPIPLITSANFASIPEGGAFSYQINASDNPTSFSADGLPVGLTLDPASGLISGAPTELGDFGVTLGATNGGGTGSLTLNITVTVALPTATLTANQPTVVCNSGQAGVCVINLPAAVDHDLFIGYQVKGDAANGTDFQTLPGFARIKAGKASKRLKIVPIGDLSGAAKKTVKIRLLPGVGYIAGTRTWVKVKILAPVP